MPDPNPQSKSPIGRDRGDAALIARGIKRGFDFPDSIRQALPSFATKMLLAKDSPIAKDSDAQLDWARLLVDIVKHTDRCEVALELARLRSENFDDGGGPVIEAKVVDSPDDLRNAIEQVWADQTYVDYVRTRSRDADSGNAREVVHGRTVEADESSRGDRS